MTFVLMIVGGKHEGVDGLFWTPDADAPEPPKRIMVGTCSGEGECSAMNREWCRAAAKATTPAGGWLAAHRRAARHPAYWTPEEQSLALVPLPEDCVPYRLANVRPTACNCCGVPVGTHAPECDSRHSEALYVIEGAPGGDDVLTVADILAAAPPAPSTAAARDALLGPGRHRRHYPRTERVLCAVLDALSARPPMGPRGWIGWT